MSNTKRPDIIKSITADRMLNRVSPIYDNSYVGLWMFEAIGEGYDELWNLIHTLPDQLFPESATWAIELWEQRYGIIPQATATLEERRQRIMSARSKPIPFTPSALQKHIQQLMRRDVEYHDNIGPYSFGVFLTANDDMGNADIRAIIDYIKRQKPSHMTFEIWFQSLSAVTIGIETGYWRFPYPATGTLNAGQLPYTNIVFAQEIDSICVNCEPIDFVFPYIAAGNGVAGRLPDYNTSFGIDASAIRASPDEQGYTIRYTPCGVSNSGTANL